MQSSFAAWDTVPDEGYDVRPLNMLKLPQSRNGNVAKKRFPILSNSSLKRVVAEGGMKQ